MSINGGIITGKKTETMLAKGEIARIEQFLLLSQCFQLKSAADASESVCMRERVKAVYLRLLMFSGRVTHIAS